MTLWQEYLAGTDPTNFSSLLLLKSDTSLSMTLSPPPPADRLVTIEATTNLFHPAWTTPPPNPVAIPDPLFYRARVTLP